MSSITYPVSSDYKPKVSFFAGLPSWFSILDADGETVCKVNVGKDRAESEAKVREIVDMMNAGNCFRRLQDEAAESRELVKPKGE